VDVTMQAVVSSPTVAALAVLLSMTHLIALSALSRQGVAPPGAAVGAPPRLQHLACGSVTV
jgi:hypothetical protein